MDQLGHLPCLGEDNGPEAASDAIEKQLGRIKIGAFLWIQEKEMMESFF